MVQKKPDPTGQRFGRLTVIRESGRCRKSNRPLFTLQCDCGTIVERTRHSFDKKGNNTPSCGCYKQELRLKLAANKRKPDPTGQRFGRLIVLGKGDKVPYNNSYRQLWQLKCDCGNVIQTPRNSFEDKGQISCGCARKLGLIDNNRKPIDIQNKRFGNLTANKLIGGKDKHKQPLWEVQCDCGNVCYFSHKQLNHKMKQCLWLNCGDKAKHPEIDCWYPATPNPYPKDAGILLQKYLYLTELNYRNIDSAVEDEKRDRLIRAAWIVTYRRSLGEYISELHELRYIKKCLRYSSISVFWSRKIEQFGGLLYTRYDNKKSIGETMTNATSLDYPELEIDLRGQNLMSSDNIKVAKRLKFKRC